MFACRKVLLKAERDLIQDSLVFSNSIALTTTAEISAISVTKNDTQVATAEVTKTELIPVLPDPDIAVNVDDVQIREGVNIHTVTYYNKLRYPDGPQPGHEPVVVTPGYACGPGFYARFAASLVKVNPNLIVSCVDWIGWGLSSFPSDLIINRADVAGTCRQFTDALDAWRAARGAPKIFLIGHSLGGYLSTLYTLDHKDKVAGLVLASSIGLPKRPDDHVPFTPANFFGRGIVNGGRYLVDKCNATPMSFLRCFGPFGKPLAGSFIARRFSMTNFTMPTEPFVDYWYHFNAQSSCGEGVVMTVLDTSAFAREPLIERFEKPEIYAELPKVRFIHGATDWVSPDTAKYLSNMNPEKYSCDILRNAGHQLFIENPDGMARLVNSYF